MEGRERGFSCLEVSIAHRLLEQLLWFMETEA